MFNGITTGPHELKGQGDLPLQVSLGRFTCPDTPVRKPAKSFLSRGNALEVSIKSDIPNAHRDSLIIL